MFRVCLCCVVLAGLPLMVVAQDIPSPYSTISFSREAVVSFSPDAAFMLVAELDGTLQFYEPVNGEVLLAAALDSEESVRFVRWKDDSSAVLLVTRQAIYRMDTATGDSKLVVEVPDDEAVTAAAFWEDDRIVARVATSLPPSFYTDYETYVWDEGSLEQTLFLPSGDDCLTSAYADPAEAELVDFMRRTGFIGWCAGYLAWSPDFSRNLRWIFWNNASARLMEVYDTTSGELLFELSHCPDYDNDDEICETTAELEEVRWSRDGTKIASLPLWGRNAVKIWDAQTGALLHTWMPTAADGSITNPRGIGWRTNGQLAAWDAYRGHVYVWDGDTGEQVFRWSHSEYLIQGMRWIRNETLAVAWGEGTPFFSTVGEIWNADTGEKLAVIHSDSSGLEDIIEDPRGYVLYLRFQDHVDVWDFDPMAKQWTLDGTG